MNKNHLLTLLTTLFLSLLMSLLIFFIRDINKSYQLTNDYAIVCLEGESCTFEDVKELTPFLKKFIHQQVILNQLVDKVANTLDVRLSSDDVKDAISIHSNQDVLTIKVQHENPAVTKVLQNHLELHLLREFEHNNRMTFIPLFESSKYGPNLLTHLKYGLTIGAFLGYFLILSGFEWKKLRRLTKPSGVN